MRQKILGVNVDFGLSMNSVVQKIDEMLQQNVKPGIVATTNPFFIMAAQEDKKFREIINSSYLSIPDGVGVLYARLFKEMAGKLDKNDTLYNLKLFFVGLKAGVVGFINREELGEVTTGVDLTDRLCQLANEKGYTVFLLGGRLRDSRGMQLNDSRYDMAKDTAERLKKKYPKLKIVGATSAFSRDSHDDEKTINYIRHCMKKNSVQHIDILLIAYNPISQEKWANRNSKNIPATISIGIGRTFDYITNNMKKPPQLYEKLHIAWLYALIKQPWRLKRVFITFPLYPLKVYRSMIKK